MSERVLIVDDNKESAKQYKRILDEAGYQADCAYDGREGLEKLKEGNVDLLILELQMPKMNGVNVLERIRANKLLRKMKVLVISSYAYKDDLIWQINGFRKRHRMTDLGRKALKKGEANHGWAGRVNMLDKPKPTFKEFFSEKFQNRLKDWLLREVKEFLERPQYSFEREKDASEPNRVLIVDDDEGVVKRIASFLKPDGYQLFFAYDGTEALERIAKEDIDLVILDLEMPRTKGDEVLRIMHSINVVENIPIIIFSSIPDTVNDEGILGLSSAKKNIDVNNVRSRARDFDHITGKIHNKPGERDYFPFQDKYKSLLKRVKSELKERHRLGYGYKKYPITIIRDKNGHWMKGYLEAYAPITGERARGEHCCYCNERKIPAYEAEFLFTDYHICPDCTQELKSKYSGFANKPLNV